MKTDVIAISPTGEGMAEALRQTERAAAYQGPVALDYYGRKVPKRVHGSRNLGRQTTSASRISGPEVSKGSSTSSSSPLSISPFSRSKMI